MATHAAVQPDSAEAPEPADDVDVVLATVEVLARFRSDGTDEPAAVADVRRRLDGVRGLFDDIVVERREDDGYYWVVARFVTVSTDVPAAVRGVHETLTAAKVVADEVWAAPQREVAFEEDGA